MALLRLLSSLTPERVTSASPRPEPRRKISKVGDIGLEPLSFSGEIPHSPKLATQIATHIPPELTRLIENWEKLSAEDRRRITAILEGRLA